MFPTTFLLLLLPLLTTTSTALFCPECGVNGIFYVDGGCDNSTYVAPLFGADAGECFEIGAPYSDQIDETAHMPFGKNTKTKSVSIYNTKDDCQGMFDLILGCSHSTYECVQYSSTQASPAKQTQASSSPSAPAKMPKTTRVGDPSVCLVLLAAA